MAASINTFSGIVELICEANTLNDHLLTCNHLTSAESQQNYEVCKARCSKLKEKTEQLNLKTSNDEDAKSILEEYAQIVLDVTYIDENQLVEDDFPEQTANTRIRNVLNHIDNILLVAKKTFPNLQPTDCLGVEIMEVILWRKGALLYMYCHQVIPDKERLKRNVMEIKQILYDGISYLRQMLDVRKPDCQQLSDLELHVNDTLQLIKSGIYTDTHLLALMYCGEMCYWYVQAVRDGLFDLSPEFAVKDIGSRVLKSYIKAVQGPLKGAGWTCDRAEELLAVIVS
ncbi:UPF0600 protein C5orf51 homolog [Gigantopelta aegis]|uniref:UPF0600 protein C5orf51 homolog n=1 Tax=Gigantopelta aegis TaxID=1735272 RepID=UPI001B88A631|nr:UPF0600 protein C5orf51 homolog [Gigantopelta aegis]